MNVPYVDWSHKWAGAGYMSNVLDLAKFGNAMLFSYQASPLSTDSRQHTSSNQDDIKKYPKTKNNGGTSPPEYLKPDTMKKIWTPAVLLSKPDGLYFRGYGMGWHVDNQEDMNTNGDNRTFFVSHTGGAIGATSTLFIVPAGNSQILNKKTTVLKHENDGNNAVKNLQETSMLNPSKGVVVAFICNMMQIDPYGTMLEITKIFKQVRL